METLEHIKSLLEPIQDQDWHGKWRIKKVLELCSNKHPEYWFDQHGAKHPTQNPVADCIYGNEDCPVCPTKTRNDI